MAGTFDASVANLVDPLANSPLNSPSHAGQHTEINDALQTLATWTTFTPTWTNFTPGSAAQSFAYTIFNKLMFVRGSVTLNGSTMGTDPSFLIPAGKSANASWTIARMLDSGTNNYFSIVFANTTTISFYTMPATGSFITLGSVSATSPFTWANNDVIDFTISFSIS
jgi:hypothetical protein